MSTEYRRGIPSTAHVEAATRLGLLWEDDDVGTMKARWRLVIRETEDVLGDYATSNTNYSNWDPGPLVRAPDAHLAYRPIRPNGTPVDWEILDQEVARVGQQGQPQGFRADLWTQISRHFSLVFRSHIDVRTRSWEDNQVSNLTEISNIDDVGIHSLNWQWGWGTADREAPTRQNRANILARWAVYQELKPLYDIVDGAHGEAAMPRDVINLWWLPARNADRTRQPIERCTLIRSDTSPRYPQGRGPTCSWYADGADVLDIGLRNFAAVLDAVAERRVAERMRGQAQEPEPRRFADVRPDRHGWQWWRVQGPGIANTTQIECSNHLGEVERQFRFRGSGFEPWTAFILDRWLDRTVIPTDEQGNPVSWESIGPTDTTEIRLTSAPGAPDRHGTHRPAPEGFSTPEGFQQALETVGFDTAKAPPITRFTADELDDVDHSRTTKLDEVKLRRGKMPTVEQIAKYREVRAKRTGGSVADALKESRIDCEVAQYVLERWAGGLDNAAAHKLIERVVETTDVGLGLFVCSAEARAQQWIDHHSTALDTSEKPNPTAQRERQEAEERRQRLAELRQRLAAERAAQPQEMAKESDTMSRFDLVEPDPQADPAASIRAWEARQAAAKARPVAAPARPAAVPRRPAIEVVDAEVDGLSRSEAFAALFGRALNGGC